MSVRLHHISLTCKSLVLCRVFYEDLGFVIHRHYQDDEVNIILMRSKGAYLELFEFATTTEGNRIKAEDRLPNVKKIGITHFALQVDNLKKTRNKLKNKHRCSKITKARLDDFSYFFTTDPEGNQIEIIGDES